jgi:DNA polymerase-3 subunit epsilon
MKLIAILDFETTGMDPTKHRVVEMGVTTWSVEHRCVVRSWSILMHGESNEAEAVNRIPAALLASTSVPGVSSPDVAWRNLQTVFGSVDAVVAYNSEFDRSFVPEDFRDMKPWICAMSDIDWPRPSNSKKLTEMALAHGLGVVQAHRALADVELIVRLLERSIELGANVEVMLTRALRPKGRVVANLPRSRNDELKAAGFRWDPDRREWWKRVFVDDVPSLPFPVSLVA